MGIWIIEPHEPLIFRDGRPFRLQPGVRAHTLSFPFPSTTTGGVRTQAGLDEHGFFVAASEDDLAALKKLKVRGPLLVRLPNTGGTGEPLEWLVPAPRDAMLFLSKNADGHSSSSPQPLAQLKRLVPLEGTGGLTDLQDITLPGRETAPLLLVGMPKPVSRKAAPDAPAYWKWDQFWQWLLAPAEEMTIERWEDLGLRGLPQEQRVHIGMDRTRHRAKEGALFETRGLEFLSTGKSGLQEARQLALAVAVDDEEGKPAPGLVPRAGFATLGSERRIVNWQYNKEMLPGCVSDKTTLVTDQVKALADIIAHQAACRVILLTPAYFKAGCYPQAVLQSPLEVRPVVKAIAIGRPQVVSGWDVAKKDEKGKARGSPKASRHLAPAGTVFFLKLQGSPEAIKQWVVQWWMQCISDEEQDCSDGFGLAVFGTWDGKPGTMEGVKK